MGAAVGRSFGRTRPTAGATRGRTIRDPCPSWCRSPWIARGGRRAARVSGCEPTERVWYYDLSDIKVGKKTPLTLDRFEEFFRLLPDRADSDHSWTVTREEIERRGYDLKAVNPNAKSTADTRTPEELLEIIEARGREVADAIAVLRGLL